MAPQGDSVRSKGEELRLQAPLDKINVHVCEGSIIPTQVNMFLNWWTFFNLRLCDMDLIVW